MISEDFLANLEENSVSAQIIAEKLFETHNYQEMQPFLREIQYFLKNFLKNCEKASDFSQKTHS